MKSKIFNVSLPVNLLEIIDLQAKLNYSTRSEYVKTAIIARLKTDGAFNQVPQTPEQARQAQLKELLKDQKIFEDEEYQIRISVGVVAATQQHAIARADGQLTEQLSQYQLEILRYRVALKLAQVQLLTQLR